MPLKKTSGLSETDRGIAFDTYEVGGKVVRVEVTTEAIQDFCRPRDLVFDGQIFPRDLLESILVAADDLVSAAPEDVRAVRITTNKLNG